MISYKVIGHKIEPGEFILKDYVQTRRKIFFSIDILSRLDVR